MEKLNEATIVSVFPWKITEEKPGLNPAIFEIPAAKDGDFALLAIRTAEMSIYMNADRGSIQIPEFANTVANAIVWDYCRAQLEFEKDVASPGLFWIPMGFGDLSKPEVLEKAKLEIKTKYAEQLTIARRQQLKWFEKLVRLADTAWNRTRNHREISDLQRMALTYLKDKDGNHPKREWYFEYVSI